MVSEIQIEDAVVGIHDKNARIRDQFFYFLLEISDQSPRQLYRYWDILLNILRRPEVSNKHIAIRLLSNLMIVDSKNKFKYVKDEWFELLNHESPVVSHHIAGTAGKIIKSKLELQNEIVSTLLDVESIRRCRHPELMKSYIIEAFDDCFGVISRDNQKKIIEFVKKQTQSTSPKTRKKAKDFISRWQRKR